MRLPTDIQAGEIKIQTYREFSADLSELTNLNLIQLKPLRGAALFVFAPSMVFTAVDKLFGGDGRFLTQIDGREFSNTEQRVINRMLKIALEAYSEAWSAVRKLDVRYLRSEMRAKFTNITSSPQDLVITTPFRIEIGTMVGECSICLPFTMVEPLRELLSNPQLVDTGEENKNWRRVLTREVQHSQLELTAHFVDIPLRLSQILKLQPGDVLPIDIPEHLVGHVNGVPVLTAQYGTLNGQYALRIERLINPILNDFNEEQPE